MRRYILLAVTTFVLLVTGVLVSAQSREQAFEIPEKYITVLLVPDSHSPVRLYGPTRAIGWDNGAVRPIFTYQNVSDQNMKSMEIRETNWYGSHGYDMPGTVNEQMSFTPWLSETITDDDVDLVPLTAAQAQEYGFAYRSNRFWIVMVTKVTLSDGTTYDVSDKYTKLDKFLDGLADRQRESSLTEQAAAEELRSFISTLMKDAGSVKESKKRPR